MDNLIEVLNNIKGQSAHRFYMTLCNALAMLPPGKHLQYRHVYLMGWRSITPERLQAWLDIFLHADADTCVLNSYVFRVTDNRVGSGDLMDTFQGWEPIVEADY